MVALIVSVSLLASSAIVGANDEPDCVLDDPSCILDPDDPWDPECDDLLQQHPCTQWVTRWNGAGMGRGPEGREPEMKDVATDSALSPDERVLVVTGESETSEQDPVAVVVAFDTTDASVLWVHVHEGGQEGVWRADALTMAPDGERVFVAMNPPSTTEGGLVQSLDLGTGNLEWSLDLGPGARVSDLTQSPAGNLLYVAGGLETGTPEAAESDAFIAALDVQTGDRVWQNVASLGEGSDDMLTKLAADDERVYAAGGRKIIDGEHEYLVLSYDASGEDPWVYRAPGTDTIISYAADIVSGKDHVYATGTRFTDDAPADHLFVFTVSLQKSDGDPQWEASWTQQRDQGQRVVLGPDEKTLFVAGRSDDFWLTMAYDTSDGALLWDAVYQAGKDHDPSDILVDPTRNRVYVAGAAFHEAPMRYAFVRGVDGVTIAYDARSGERQWIRSYDGPGHNFDAHVGIHLVDRGNRLLAAGYGWGDTSADALMESLTSENPLTYEPRESSHNDVHLVSYLLEDDAGRLHAGGPSYEPLVASDHPNR